MRHIPITQTRCVTRNNSHYETAPQASGENTALRGHLGELGRFGDRFSVSLFIEDRPGQWSGVTDDGSIASDSAKRNTCPMGGRTRDDSPEDNNSLHCLQRLFNLLCGQMLPPPHSLHWLFRRLCTQIPLPKQLLTGVLKSGPKGFRSRDRFHLQGFPGRS